MKTFWINLLICYLLLGTIILHSQNRQKPNVIVIYTDDQGAVDLGCYGASDIYSPNIDKLAKQGIRFTQAYVAAPVCAPSRAALLTGNYPQRAGVSGNTSAEPGSNGLLANQYTMAELFKDNGYVTGHIGKWHLGMSEESSPNAQGFDYSFGHLRGCIDNYSHYFYWEGPNIHDLYENGKETFQEGKYFPDLMAEKTSLFINKNQRQPFFLFYAINMPHYPYQPTKKWRDYYKNMDFPRAGYAAFISTIDERIGLLMNQLDSLGIRENTIIVYQSDNGYSTETRAFKGGGNSGPYRGAKSSLFEGGIRLPTIISWKDNLLENSVNNEMLLNTDWMPTLASLCDLKVKTPAIDGIDMSKMLINSDQKSHRKITFWKYGSQWVVRKDNWKLIGYPKDTSYKAELDAEEDALFLSNLEDNVSEMHNLASQFPEKVKELSNLFCNWEFGSESDIPKLIEIVAHLGKKATVKNSLPLYKKYNKIEVLNDGKRGNFNYDSGQWVGQEVNDLEFIIDLKKEMNIKNISCGYLNDPGNWIFKPVFMEVSFSKDGKSFSDNTKTAIDSEPYNPNKVRDLLQIEKEINSRYVKVKVKNSAVCPDSHIASGSEAWIFIDEIILE